MITEEIDKTKIVKEKIVIKTTKKNKTEIIIIINKMKRSSKKESN